MLAAFYRASSLLGHIAHTTGSDPWPHGISSLVLTTAQLQSELDYSFLLGGLSGPHFLFLSVSLCRCCFEIGTPYVAQASLKLLSLFPQPPQWWMPSVPSPSRTMLSI